MRNKLDSWERENFVENEIMFYFDALKRVN